MLWLTVGLLVAVLIIACDKSKTIELSVVFLALLALASGLTLNITSGILFSSVVDYSVQQSTPIYSLDATNEVTGDFVLGSGDIKTGAVYYYYTRDSSGGYHLSSIPAGENTVIYEQDNIAPRIDTSGPPGWFLFFSTHYDMRYKVYLPEGSIVQRYSPNVGGR